MKSAASIQKVSHNRKEESKAPDFLSRPTLSALRESARSCQACPLFRRATQTVFGKGPAHAKLMLVGEIPGDQEDLQGLPFVGPAGKLLDSALAAAGLARKDIYLTNAVKHFKWEQRGKRRLHGKPSAREISACRPWLEAEIRAIHPQTIICLGATAAQTLLGRTFRLTQHLGESIVTDWARSILATYHPSAILRAPDPQRRTEMKTQLVHDLQVAATRSL